jgi:hypothetical protein
LLGLVGLSGPERPKRQHVADASVGGHLDCSPEIKQAYAYWRGKLRGRPMPSRADIEPAEVKALLPKLFMVDVEYEPVRFRYRLIGTDIVTSLGRDATGRAIDESTFGEHATIIQSVYGAVVACRRPVAVRGRTTWLKDREWKRFQNLLLPLSSNGNVVDIILGVFEVRSIISDRNTADGDALAGEFSLIVKPDILG